MEFIRLDFGRPGRVLPHEKSFVFYSSFLKETEKEICEYCLLATKKTTIEITKTSRKIVRH